MFRQTLADHKLSRGERSALGQIFEHVEPGRQKLALYRSIAFDLAREASDGGASGNVIDWLEDAVKLLDAQNSSSKGLTAAEAYFSPGEDSLKRITGLLNTARRKVDICVFTITDDRISGAILDAFRRKVAIRIVTDDDKAGDRGSDVDRLADAGIPVRFDRTRFHMHHKFALFDDGLLLTGSYNWTRSAASSNEENLVVTEDPRLITPFSQVFEDLWEKFS